ncbi:BIR-domain-containing protein [Wallemia mellicola]|uniref:BIR-domain-containing protein n=1 Tax=Wallemia mellicola TaxID=1708541 RepID=A0A4T0TWH0_9BASI|nr:BIR-domain-containing protein [Wallemia mellicola]
MEIYTKRLKSYNKTYHRNVAHLDVEALSKAGFYAMESKSDKVQCAYCDLKLSDWKEDDNASGLHLEFSPQCPYARVVCGIALDESIWGAEHGGKNRTEYYDDEPTQAGRVPRSRPMIDARKSTFVKCVRPLSVSVHKLALAGFYYAPTEDAFDNCECACCEINLSEWQKGDDPTEEHRNRSPNCSFFHAKVVKGTCPHKKVQNTQKDTTKKTATQKKGKSISRTASMTTDNGENEIVVPKRVTRTRSQSKQPEEIAPPVKEATTRRKTSRTVSQQKKAPPKSSKLEDLEESPKKSLPPTPKEENPTNNLSPLPELSNSNGIKSSRQLLNQFNKSPSRLKEVTNSDENGDRSLTLAEFIRKCVTDESNKMRQLGDSQIQKFESKAKLGEDELRAKLSQARL